MAISIWAERSGPKGPKKEGWGTFRTGNKWTMRSMLKCNILLEPEEEEEEEEEEE
jgi:hypothetical protein